MLRTFALPDLLTLANAGCGTVAIFMCLSYLERLQLARLWISFSLLPLALIFDVLDGAIARRTHHRSVLGSDLDSLADVVSFGVAPAVIGYTVGLRGAWDVVVLTYFVGCGISRLARYNVTAKDLSDESGKVRYYEGTPIPSSVVLVAVLAIALWLGQVQDRLWLGSVRVLGLEWHPLSLMYVVSGSAMVSARIRIPKL